MAELKTTSIMDNRGFVRGVDQMKKEVGGFESRLKALKGTMAAAFSLGAVTAGIRSMSEYAREVNVAAQQSKLTTDQIQALAYAAQATGAEIDNVRGMMSSMREAMSDAVKNGGTMAQTFRNLGIETSQLAKMTEGQLLEALAKGYKETNNFTELVRVLGEEDLVRTESALVRLADNGFGKLIDAAREAGQVMNREAIEAAKAADEAFDRLGISVKATAANLLLRDAMGEYGTALESNYSALVRDREIREGMGDATSKSRETPLEAMRRRQRRLEFGTTDDDLRRRAREITDAEFAMRAATIARARAQGAQTYDRQDPFAQLAEWTEQFDKLIPAFAKKAADAVAAPSRAVVDRNVADNLERVGGYMGPAADGVRAPMERQIEETKKTNSILEKMQRDVVDVMKRDMDSLDKYGLSLVGP